MKNILYFIALLCCVAFIACDKQTTPEALDVQVPPTKSDDYFEALRQYKKSKHQLCFGWFGNWTATGSAMSTRLDNVPDSVDIISIWGNTFNLTPEMKADMAYVQQKKGTKVIFTIFAHTVPELFIAEDGTIDYASYAKSLNDTIIKYNYDGIDFDYEPNYGGSGPLCDKNNMETFIHEMGKYVGPKSGTGKILSIDGEPYYMNPGLSEYFDYGIVQAYNSTGDTDLQNRFNRAAEVGWKPEQYIFTENFESLWQTGGNPSYRDKYGNVIHLGERDCSVQRNHQKMIEESPSPALDESLRQKMGEAAVRAAKAAHYENAGTIEFLLEKNGNFYFMEMNTRIQVEHPVTEWVTGIDLVKEQIRIASGEALSYTQDEVRLTGHAIECRINAENPEKGFRPSPGTITDMYLPGGKGIRIDSAIYSGYTIPPYYDSMVAKLIVWAKNRKEAIRKMQSALGEVIIEGIDTNVDYQYEILNHPDYRSGNIDIEFIERL